MKLFIRLLIFCLPFSQTQAKIIILYEGQLQHAQLASKQFNKISKIPSRLIHIKKTQCSSIREATLVLCLDKRGHLTLKQVDEKKLRKRYQVFKSLREVI